MNNTMLFCIATQPHTQMQNGKGTYGAQTKTATTTATKEKQPTKRECKFPIDLRRTIKEKK